MANNNNEVYLKLRIWTNRMLLSRLGVDVFEYGQTESPQECWRLVCRTENESKNANVTLEKVY